VAAQTPCQALHVCNPLLIISAGPSTIAVCTQIFLLLGAVQNKKQKKQLSLKFWGDQEKGLFHVICMGVEMQYLTTLVSVIEALALW
jgi:hypothetical protein